MRSEYSIGPITKAENRRSPGRRKSSAVGRFRNDLLLLTFIGRLSYSDLQEESS
jgi:hypothetical protein